MLSKGIRWQTVVGLSLFLTGAVRLSAIATAAADVALPADVTYARDIAPILQRSCENCHRTDGVAPMALSTYEEVRPWARAIKEEVLTRRMPKWQAARGYGDFSNDPSLSPFQIALVVAWADGGAPRGTDADLKTTPATATVVDMIAEPGARELKLLCREQPAPQGTLLAIRPELEPKGSIGVAVNFPDGRREIVGWIRDYDPANPTTYRLRVPLSVPGASTLIVEAAGACSLTLTVAESR